jgi:hypothetical protein
VRRGKARRPHVRTAGYGEATSRGKRQVVGSKEAWLDYSA